MGKIGYLIILSQALFFPNLASLSKAFLIPKSPYGNLVSTYFSHQA